MTDRLFVYGTLAPGRANEHILQSVPGTWEPAVVKGRLFEHGWGAAMGFPALVLQEDGLEVRGLLFSSPALPDHWDRLDEFEGPGYRRVLTQVQGPNGDFVDAYVYVVR